MILYIKNILLRKLIHILPETTSVEVLLFASLFSISLFVSTFNAVSILLLLTTGTFMNLNTDDDELSKLFEEFPFILRILINKILREFIIKE